MRYDARRRVVACDVPRELDLGVVCLGADDRAGPNSTGRPAVDSYYAVGSGTRTVRMAEIVGYRS